MTSTDLPALGYGVATSSYQIEGALDADGRGRSIWDVFAARPGAVRDGSDGHPGCGSYERLDEDLQLVADLGVRAYRFSIAWPRVQPDGRGRVEERGLDYYDRLVDGLLARGIRPLPTLYHWDLPQPLEDAGGWPARDTTARFAEYATVVAGRLGNRVSTWATVNEPWCSAFLGYAAGIHAPGRRDPQAAYAAAHHLLLGHALAAQAVRSVATSADVGIVLNLYPVWPEEGADPGAVDVVDAVQNRLWLDALTSGRYPEVLEHLADPALVRDGDLAAVQDSASWLGVNYYTPFRVAPADRGAEPVSQDTAAYPGAPPFRFAPRQPLTDLGWEVQPAGLEEVLLRVARYAPGVPLRVTENGAAFPDDVRTADGAVDDQDRIDYLRGHLDAVEHARAAGAPVHDYITWTLMDNYEWAEGYTKTFGLVEVDLDTLARRPKASYRWYADRVRQG